MSHSLFMQIEWGNYNQRVRGQFSIRENYMRCVVVVNSTHTTAAVTTLRLNVLISTEE